MRLLALVGVPRTAYALYESVIQMRTRGYEVALVDDKMGLASVPRSLPVKRLIEVESLSADTVAQILEPLAPERVLSFSELHLVLAADVRERLRLPGESSEVEALVRDKAATRGRLTERGLSGVRYAMTNLDRLAETASDFTPPFVVKPFALTGSIGVRAIRSHEEISSYTEQFDDPSLEAGRGRPLLVEDFIPGTEYSVEGICVRGAFHLLAVTGKRTSGFPYFYETGHLLPDPAQESDPRFGTYLQEVISALGIDTAPIHAEVKVSDDAIELIEIHTRFGGDLIPALMEKALDIRVFGYFYDALLYGWSPEPPSGLARVAGVRFLCRPLEDAGLRIPKPPRGVRAEMVVGGGDGHEPGALDNIRIPNQRYGHIVFTAPSHEAAEGFAAQLDRDWQDDS